jgi:hypothetical protein
MVSHFPHGLWQRRSTSFVLDVAPEMKIKECEVGWPWRPPDVYFDQPTFCIMWHQEKLWPCSDNATERRAVKTGCLLPRCLPAGGYKEQIQHVRIRDSSHCFLNEEEWLINRAPMNNNLKSGPLLGSNSFSNMWPE